MRSFIPAAAFAAAFALPAFGAIDVQFAPGSKPAYRKVFIAPATVEFQPAFLQNQSYTRHVDRLTRVDTDKIARRMGESFRGALGEAFKARGFELASAPSPDALQIAPALREVYVNAPERSTTAAVRQYVREAGEATMVVEGRDASGARVLSAKDHLSTTRSEDFQRTSDVTNNFWFESMFRRWADDLAAAVASR